MSNPIVGVVVVPSSYALTSFSSPQHCNSGGRRLPGERFGLRHWLHPPSTDLSQMAHDRVAGREATTTGNTCDINPAATGGPAVTARSSYCTCRTWYFQAFSRRARPAAVRSRARHPGVCCGNKSRPPTKQSVRSFSCARVNGARELQNDRHRPSVSSS